MANKRKCILCPTHEYEYCGKCKPQETIQTWRYIFDSENCRDIYKILENYVAKKVNALEAKQQLSNYVLPPMEEIQPTLRKNLEDILNQTKENFIAENTEEKSNLLEDKTVIEEEIIKPRRRRYSRRNKE